jgi:hypothetical protein
VLQKYFEADTERAFPGTAAIQDEIRSAPEGEGRNGYKQDGTVSAEAIVHPSCRGPRARARVCTIYLQAHG